MTAAVTLVFELRPEAIERRAHLGDLGLCQRRVLGKIVEHVLDGAVELHVAKVEESLGRIRLIRQVGFSDRPLVQSAKKLQRAYAVPVEAKLEDFRSEEHTSELQPPMY